MDDSSICRTAVASALIGDHTGGIVTFELVNPIPFYPACSMWGKADLDDPKSSKVQIETMTWTWQAFGWAKRPENIERFCDKAWISANPGVPCRKCKDTYQTQCTNQNGYNKCFGVYAFKFVKPCGKPVITPDTGIFEDSLDVHITPDPKEPLDPGTQIVCTTDGKAPDVSKLGNYPPVPPDGIIKLLPGNYTIKCAAASSIRGPSRITKSAGRVDVLPRLPPPDIDPDDGQVKVERAMVSIDPVVKGAKIFYTLDGSDPTAKSEPYKGIFQINTVGINIVKAMTVKVEWASSPIVSNTIRILPRVASPYAVPYMGAFTNTLTAHLECPTPGAKMYYTTDGTAPTAASLEYHSSDGIVLGLDADGNMLSHFHTTVSCI